jgi:hypothetical protein
VCARSRDFVARDPDIGIERVSPWYAISGGLERRARRDAGTTG